MSAARHLVLEPDHDLREQHPDAVPLFDEAHLGCVRQRELPRVALRSGGDWKHELRDLLERAYLDDDGTIFEELCNAEDDPDGALRCYRAIAARTQRERGNPKRSC